MIFIALKFADYCRGCGKKMKPGDPAAWFGKKDGVKHLGCYISKKSILETEINW